MPNDDEKKNVPPPPETPRPGTPRPGAHSTIDTRAMAERAIDKVRDVEKVAMHADDRSAEALLLSKKHAEMIELLPAMNTKLELALRPRPIHPAVQGAIAFAAVVCTVCLVAITVTIVHPTSARASVETARR
jgi:Iap family predicted aminopeptidase